MLTGAGKLGQQGMQAWFGIMWNIWSLTPRGCPFCWEVGKFGDILQAYGFLVLKPNHLKLMLSLRAGLGSQNLVELSHEHNARNDTTILWLSRYIDVYIYSISKCPTPNSSIHACDFSSSNYHGLIGEVFIDCLKLKCQGQPSCLPPYCILCF